MVSGSVRAGIIALVSLAVPLDIEFKRYFFAVAWSLFYVDVFSRGTRFILALQFLTLSSILTTMIFLFVLVGAILLFVKQNSPKIGASLVLVGLLFYVVDLLYLELFVVAYTPIPLGFFIGLVAAAALYRAYSELHPTRPELREDGGQPTRKSIAHAAGVSEVSVRNHLNMIRDVLNHGG